MRKIEGETAGNAVCGLYLFGGKKVVALAERELVQMLPNIFLGALVQQGMMSSIYIYYIGEIAVFEFHARLALREQFCRMVSVGKTKFGQRTTGTGKTVVVGRGKRGGAIERPKFHNGGIEQTGVLSVKNLLNQVMKMFLARRGIKNDITIEQPSHNPIDIAVHGGVG